MTIALFLYLPAAILLASLGVAGYQDWRAREVPDEIWLIMGTLGMAVLLASQYGSPLLSLALDAVGALFALQHVIPWDRALGDRQALVGAVEGLTYVGVTALAVYTYLFYRSLASPPFLAIVVVVLIARGLFEARLLYGGADAKAIMVSAVVLPFWPQPILTQYPTAISLTPLPWLPFSLSMLVDGTILTLAVPLWVLAHNIRQGYVTFPEAFTLYEIPSSDLPRKFVWLRRPLLGDNEDVETAEADQELRATQAAELERRAIDRVWVTPQLPMVLAIALGALLALLVGNVLFWIL